MTTAPHPTEGGMSTEAWERDCGCSESPTCVTCPLPMCRYEDDHFYQQWQAWRRAMRLVPFLALHPTVAAAARAAGTTAASMSRATARVAAGEPGRAQ